MASLARAARPLLKAYSACPVSKSIPSRSFQQSACFPLQVPPVYSNLTRLHPFSTSLRRRYADPIDHASLVPTPITHFSETETMMAESVSRFANEVIAPKVREMDEAEKMDLTIVEQLFEQGLMGVEIPEEYGGAGMNFTSAIVGIEELARVDPSVSVMVDVHNTLVNTAILKHGSTELKKKWLPRLATNTVGKRLQYKLNICH